MHVRISLHEIPNALMVPQAAIGSSQLGKYVYVVSPESKVEQRLVSLGPTEGDGVVVASGVSEGDNMITGNLQKIGPGAPVKPQPAPQGGCRPPLSEAGRGPSSPSPSSGRVGWGPRAKRAGKKQANDPNPTLPEVGEGFRTDRLPTNSHPISSQRGRHLRRAHLYV